MDLKTAQSTRYTIDEMIEALPSLGLIDDEDAPQAILLEAMKNVPSLIKETSSKERYNIMHILVPIVTNPEVFLTEIKSQISPKKLSKLLSQKDYHLQTPIDLAQQKGNEAFLTQLKELACLPKNNNRVTQLIEKTTQFFTRN